ncbi:MAG: HopJ type III effector protein [Gammaproteobacteria bacterium]|nr:HopJ type III effector protein [Gammaproteobacteria bacterium]
MTPTELVEKLRTSPATVEFDEVIAVIDAHYYFTPTGFANGLGAGRLWNPMGTNEGSCRILAFGRLHGLSEAETLPCFGAHYRDVVADPEGTAHANIRAFMRDGWAGIKFEGTPLLAR